MSSHRSQEWAPGLGLKCILLHHGGQKYEAKGRLFLEGLRGHVLQASPTSVGGWQSLVFLGLRMFPSNLCLCLHTCPVCMCVCVVLSHKDTHWMQGPL